MGPPPLDRSSVAPLCGLMLVTRWAISLRKIMTSLLMGSRPARCGVSVKVVPEPAGAQSGWAPLPIQKMATLTGCETAWPCAVRTRPDMSAPPAPRPRSTERREKEGDERIVCSGLRYWFFRLTKLGDLMTERISSSTL
jgi:hypothetical protein